METGEFLQTLWRERAVAIMRASSREVALGGVSAAIRGGFGAVEFTMTTPDVLGLIEEVSARGDAVVGAGTVMTVAEAEGAVRAGARFLVSPICDEEVIGAARDLGVAVIPGCQTPTEMVRAHRAGAPLVKLFPAAAGGPDAVRSILGPLPFLRIVPTNGVDRDNVADYLSAGAFAVGCVRALFEPGAMARRDWDAITERARALRAAADAADRPDRPPAARDWSNSAG